MEKRRVGRSDDLRAAPQFPPMETATLDPVSDLRETERSLRAEGP